MVSDRTKNIAIGIFVLISLVLMVWVLLFLRPVVGDQGQTLRVRFTNIDKVAEGTRVLFAGQPVGEVVKVTEIPDARNNPVNGRVYIYELTLKVDSSIDVYPTDDISVSTSGLLGERSVSIMPRPPASGKAPQRLNDTIIVFATPTGSVEETFSGLNKLSSKAEILIDHIIEGLDKWKSEKVWENVADTVASFKDMAKTLDQPEKLSDILDNIQGFSKNLGDVGSELPKTWAKLDSSVEDVVQITKNFNDVSHLVNQIMANVQSGEGTLGRLLMKDDFYLQLKALLFKADVTMNDINHYGVLFHLDKKWQRLRARRANLMNTLCTPQQFRNYFEDEVDEVTTGLSRVTYVLDQTACREDLMGVVGTCEFEQVFSDLLRKVTNLEEMLELYNLQVQEKREQKCCSFE